MIEDAVQGIPFDIYTNGWPTGLAGTIGYRIRAAGADVVPRTTAGVVEDIAGSGIYRATVTIAAAGDYQIVWDDGAGGFSEPEPVTVNATAQPFASSALLKWDALTDIATAAAYIGIDVPVAGSADERNLYRLINSTSRAIRRWCERQFTPERGAGGVYNSAALSTDALALGHQRTIDYDGSAIVKLRPYEPRNITAVDLLAAGSGTATPTPLQTDLDYVAMPREQTDNGTWLYLAVRDIGNSSIGELLAGVSDRTPSRGFPSWPGGYALRVTGDWGMAAPPDDVVEACLVAIDEQWTNPEGYQSRSSGEIAATEIVPAARAPAIASPFPQRAELLLAPYRRGPEL